MAEKKVYFDLKSVRFWDKNNDFSEMSLSGTVPILEVDSFFLSGSVTICEYFEEIGKDNTFLPGSPLSRAIIRSLVANMEEYFFDNCVKPILYERVINCYKLSTSPNSSMLRIARKTLHEYIQWICSVLEKTQWISGDIIGMADIAAAAQFSVLDYLNEISWNRTPQVFHTWYSVIKSRPSFRDILRDRIPGFQPQKTYERLDF